MPYDDLRDWIQALDRADELKRIRTEADPILEITEITDRVSKSPATTSGRTPSGACPERSRRDLRSEAPQLGGKALLFENLKGYPG